MNVKLNIRRNTMENVFENYSAVELEEVKQIIKIGAIAIGAITLLGIVEALA